MIKPNIDRRITLCGQPCFDLCIDSGIDSDFDDLFRLPRSGPRFVSRKRELYITAIVRRSFWVFPKTRFVEYETRDEVWARRLGFGHEECWDVQQWIFGGFAEIRHSDDEVSVNVSGGLIEESMLQRVY